jgi:N-6 DNA Methylase
MFPPSDSQVTVPASAVKPFLELCGYTGSLLQRSFSLGEGRSVPLVGFARPPADARTSCIAVLEANSGSEELVATCRPLAAPLVFVCGKLGLEWWQQTSVAAVRQGPPIPMDRLESFFRTHRSEFSPNAIYRAKTWGRFDTQYQRSFVDVGLMPVVEGRIGEELTTLVSRSVEALKSLLGWRTPSDEQGQWLLKSVFWIVSAKILRDKEVGRFAKLDPLDVEPLLDAIAEHYDAKRVSINSDRQRRALGEIAADVTQFSDLRLATTESLAYVYENALISKATRQELGTHSTPSYLVDYVVGRLTPWITEIPMDVRNVFEPACGHAAFLVSAMRVLTELLPEEKAVSARRHRYLRSRVHGCDIDEFALEIARLSLSLTDIPNPDGWDLFAGDMFEGDRLERKSRDATIFLANPPFENFSPESRVAYKNRGVEFRHVNKTAELLARALPELRNGAVLGVVVPQGFLNSKNALDVRRLLTTQFEVQEICLFPDKVFKFSDMESAILVARKHERSSSARVRYRRVRERDIDAFQKDYRATIDVMATQSRFESSCDLRIPDLEAVWERCDGFQKFEAIAEIGQGFAFKGKDLAPGVITSSDRRFPGAVRGFLAFDEGLGLHELPRAVWLNLSGEAIRRPLHGTAQGLSQVLVNEAPSSRGPWRLKALIDFEGHPVTGRFNVVRPRGSQPLELLWALCNSPVANAYAFGHSGKRHNDAGMIRAMPIPELNGKAAIAVTEAAHRYLDYVRPGAEVLQRPTDERIAKELLLRVDNEVLRLYSLPRELEWQVLNYFAGWARGGVPFSFERYFPGHFADQISLADYLAITSDWTETNRRRETLIQKKVARTISAEQRTELDHLQSLTSSRVRLLAPLPLEALEEARRRIIGGAQE